MAGKHHGLHVKYLFWSWTGNVLRKKWFYCRKQGWKCLDVSWKPPCFIATNTADDGSTKKNTNAPQKRGPFCSILTYKFEIFPLLETTKCCRKNPLRMCEKKDAFDNPESTSEEIISTLGVKMAAVCSVWTVESTYADSQTPVTQPSHLLGLCDI